MPRKYLPCIVISCCLLSPREPGNNYNTGLFLYQLVMNMCKSESLLGHRKNFSGPVCILFLNLSLSKSALAGGVAQRCELRIYPLVLGLNLQGAVGGFFPRIDWVKKHFKEIRLFLRVERCYSLAAVSLPWCVIPGFHWLFLHPGRWN